MVHSPFTSPPATHLAAALALIPALFATAAGGQSFDETAEVVVVEVPVHVVRDEQPVRGLTADDFELFDGKKKQKLVGFEVIDLASGDLGGGAGPAASLPAAGRRHFLLLFDLAFSRPQSIVKARDAALDLVRGGLHPSDLVAVATYSMARGPRLIITFTSDRNQAEGAIMTLGVSQVADLRPDPLGVMLMSVDQELLSKQSGGRPFNDIGPRNGPTGAFLTPELVASLEADIEIDLDATLQDQLRSLSLRSAQVDRQFEASRVTGMARSLADLGTLLDAVNGRKHVVYLSEGFDSSLMLGEGNTQANNRAVESGQLWDVSGDKTFGDTGLQNDVQEMLDAFRRADCVIHTVNIGGIQRAADVGAAFATNLATQGSADLASLGGSGRNTLLTMAQATGGSFYDNENDLYAAMDKLLLKTSVTYLLAFQPRGLAQDGAYHRLRVRLKKAARGIRLEHRPGYYAPKPSYQRSALERRLTTAKLIMSDRDQGSLKTSILVAPLLVPGGPAYVPLVVEVDGRSLLEGEHHSGVLQAEIFAYATDGGGQFVDFFTQLLELDLAKTRPLLERAGLRYYGHLDLPPGEFTLRVLVRNSFTGKLALRVQPLTIPATAGALSLAPPFFAQDDGDRWVFVEEGPTRVEKRDFAFPFVHGEERFMPPTAPRLRAGGEVPVVLLGHGLLTAELVAAVIDAGGRAIGAAQLEVDTRGPAPQVGDEVLARFRPGDLPAGAYRLRVTATDPATGDAASSSLPFTVAGGGR